MLKFGLQLGDCNSWVDRVSVHYKLHEVSCFMKFRTLCMILSLSFFLAKVEPYSPVTTIAKDLLITGITFGIMENCTNKGAYDNKFL